MELIENPLFLQKLKEKGKEQLAYDMLRKQYETNSWQHHSNQQKVGALIELAALSLAIGRPAKCSLPYIDEALVLAEGVDEEVRGDYTQCLESQKDEYLALVKRLE